MRPQLWNSRQIPPQAASSSIDPMIIDSHHPLFWYDDHLTLSELRRALHTTYRETLRILEMDSAPVYRLAYGTRFRYFVKREEARRLARIHGSESARNRRQRRSASRTCLNPLPGRCPRCGEKGKQWRNGLNTAGNREVKCGHCKRFYTITFNKRPPLESVCTHCGANTRQNRMQLTSAGNQTIRCGHCRKHYTIKGSPESPQNPAPFWSLPHGPSPQQFEW